MLSFMVTQIQMLQSLTPEPQRITSSVSVFAGRQQPTDRAESRAATNGAAGPAGPVQTGVSGGSDPPAGLEGGAGCLRYITDHPTETVSPLKPPGYSNRCNTNTGIHLEKYQSSPLSLPVFNFKFFNFNLHFLSCKATPSIYLQFQFYLKLVK